jgi:hypothetical protein
MPTKKPVNPENDTVAASPAQGALLEADAPAAEPAAKPARKPGRPAGVKRAASTGTPKPAKLAKPAKPAKPVRDSFTMPAKDFALIAALKARGLARQRDTRKSELLRAGLHALAALDDTALLAMLNQLEPIKTGRPKKRH